LGVAQDVSCTGCEWEIVDKAQFEAKGFEINLVPGDDTEGGKCKANAAGDDCDREACQLGSYSIEIKKKDGGKWYYTQGGETKEATGTKTIPAKGKDDDITQYACGTIAKGPENPTTPGKKKADRTKKQRGRAGEVKGSYAYTGITLRSGRHLVLAPPHAGANKNQVPEFDFTKQIELMCTACEKDHKGMPV
jgi:hypothetical protein